MKKTIIGIAIVVIAMVSMTSCENKEKCWQAKITETYAYANTEDENELETDEIEYWIWGTEEEVDAAIAALEKVAANENFPLATKAMFNDVQRTLGIFTNLKSGE